MPHHSSRALHLTTTGLGKHHTSPKKPHNKKNSQIVVPLGNASKHQQLLRKLAILRGTQTSAQLANNPTTSDPDPTAWEDIVNNDQVDTTEALQPREHQPAPCPQNPSGCRTTQSAAASLRLYTSWAEILPGLVHPLLKYLSSTVGSVMFPVNNIQSTCFQSCITSHTSILCLYFNCA